MGNPKMTILKNTAETFTLDGQLHFKVEDVKRHLTDMKIDTSKIITHTVNGRTENIIAESYIQPMTDFDKKIAQTFNYNPNK